MDCTNVTKPMPGCQRSQDRRSKQRRVGADQARRSRLHGVRQRLAEDRTRKSRELEITLVMKQPSCSLINECHKLSLCEHTDTRVEETPSRLYLGPLPITSVSITYWLVKQLGASVGGAVPGAWLVQGTSGCPWYCAASVAAES